MKPSQGGGDLNDPPTPTHVLVLNFFIAVAVSTNEGHALAERNELALHESARYQNNNCHRSFPFRDVLILCISQESHVCLHVDCESFTLALWPTLRKKFMNF